MREKTLEAKLRKQIKLRKGLALKWVSPGFTGVPDRIVIMPGGLVYLVEMKCKKGTLSPRQQVVIPQLQKLGLDVRVIDDDIKLKEFLTEVDKAVKVAKILF